MANSIKEYLTFTKKERNGLMFLLAIILLVAIYLNIDFKHELDDKTDMAQFESDLATLTEASKSKVPAYTTRSDKAGQSAEVEKEPKTPYVYHEFDPNFVTDEEWKEMGLKEWQINGLRAYREKAGDIRSPEQFAKLNVVTDEFFEKVKSFLVFEVKKEAPELKKNEDKRENKEEEKKRSIPLNVASAARLAELRGIGPAYSNRIVKYRRWLGGFRKKEQLLEVYGMEDSLYQEIIPFLTLDTGMITKINVNSVMIAELRKHPYIKWNIANAIVNYRDQHGPYESVEDIKNTDLVSPELYRKIAPYLEVSAN